MPMATDRLKNNCPMASTTTLRNDEMVILLKSGTTKTLNPSQPVRVTPEPSVYSIVRL